MSFEPHNLLVTGGAGFIGANFIHHWLREASGARVVVLDAPGKPLPVHGDGMQIRDWLGNKEWWRPLLSAE